MSILELENLMVFLILSNTSLLFFEILSGKLLSQSKSVIHISCNRTFLCTTYGERNPSGLKSVMILLRKFGLVCSSSLQPGTLASLNVNVNASSLGFHNILQVLLEGNSPHFKITSIALSSCEISFKTSDSFDIHLRACIPAFPHNSGNSLYSFLLHHRS